MADNKKIAENIKKKNAKKPKGYWLDMPEEEGLEDADFVPIPTPQGIVRKGIKAVAKHGIKKGAKELAKAVAKKGIKSAANEAGKKRAHNLPASTIKDPPSLDKGYGKSTYEKMPKWKAKMQQKKYYN